MDTFRSLLPIALAIWSILLVLSVGPVTALLARTPVRRRQPVSPMAARKTETPGWQRIRSAVAAARTAPPAGDTAADAAADADRYAEEVAVAAARAAASARKRHAQWVHAAEALDTAWQVYEAADAAARQAFRAAAFSVLATVATPAELARRERHLQRAALAAYLRGEVSADQVFDALAHRNGFDPHRHPDEQEATLRRLACDHRLRGYRTAVAAERAAWHDADLAVAAKRSLDDEAFAATTRAHAVHRQLAARPQPRRETRAHAHTPPAPRLAA